MVVSPELLSAGISAGSSLFGGALGMLSGGTSAYQQYKYQKKLNQHAYDLTQQGYRESYGNIRQGLVNAGYNPLLAVNGMSGATFSGGSASAANMDGSGYANSYTNAKQQRSQQALNDASIAQLESQVGVNNAEANYKEGLLQSELIKQTGYSVDNQIKELERQKSKKELSIYDERLLEELKNLRKDTALKEAKASQAYSDAVSNRIQAEAAETNAKGSYYYNTHRALGFSESNSSSSDYSASGKLFEFDKNGNRHFNPDLSGKYGHSSSYSRSW